MSEIHRVCPRCGASVPLESRHCSRCGYDASAGLPVERRALLPAQVTRAALPVVAGIAGIALRAGWRLLRRRLAALAEQATPPPETPPVVERPPVPVAPSRPRRTIRIRSHWAIGDANGVWRQGAEEHIIEIDD